MSLVGIGEERLWGDCEANLDWEGRDRSSVEVGIWQLDELELLRFIASVQGSQLACHAADSFVSSSWVFLLWNTG
jgi:hypothetical protein